MTTTMNFRCPHCGETTRIPTNAKFNIGCNGIGCGTIILIFLLFAYMSQIEGCVTRIIQTWRGDAPTTEVAE